ncbi:unnamed protein product [Sphacelaria rigidula]
MGLPVAWEKKRKRSSAPMTRTRPCCIAPPVRSVHHSFSRQNCDNATQMARSGDAPLYRSKQSRSKAQSKVQQWNASHHSAVLSSISYPLRSFRSSMGIAKAQTTRSSPTLSSLPASSCKNSSWAAVGIHL